MIGASFADPTVLVACITSGGSLLAILLASLLSQRNQKRQKVALDDTRERLQEIHIIVNSQKTEMEQRIVALETKLGLAPGEAIPAPRAS